MFLLFFFIYQISYHKWMFQFRKWKKKEREKEGSRQQAEVIIIILRIRSCNVFYHCLCFFLLCRCFLCSSPFSIPLNEKKIQINTFSRHICCVISFAIVLNISISFWITFLASILLHNRSPKRNEMKHMCKHAYQFIIIINNYFYYFCEWLRHQADE